MKTLGHVLLLRKNSSGTNVVVEPIKIQSVQTSAPYFLLDEIALGGDVEISVHSAQPMDQYLRDYATPDLPKVDGMKFSQRKFSSLLVVELPSFAGSTKFRNGLTDDQSQAPRGESLALFPVSDAVQLPANAQAIGLLSAEIYQLNVTDLETHRSEQLGFVVPGSESVNWPTIAHNLRRRCKREAQELKQIESEIAPTARQNVEQEVIEPDLTLVAGPDAKYVVRQLKRLNRGSILKTVQVVDGYLIEDPDHRLHEAKKYVAGFKENLIARNSNVKNGMEKEFFPELFQ